MALSFALGTAASAQRILSLDLGGAHVRYADTLSTAAFSVMPSVRLESARAMLRTTGTFSQLGTGSWTAQGAADGSLFTPSAGPLLAELSASGGGSTHEDGARTGQAEAMVRAHLLARRVGFWAGAGGGSTWDGFVWRAIRQGEAGAWARVAAGSALVSVTPTEVDDTIDYVDTQISLRWDLHRVELGASAGLRWGEQLSTLGGTAKSWGSISAVAWLTPHAGIVASAGTYPVDLTQGFPGGRFARLGVRVGWPRRATASLSPAGVASANSDSANPGNGILTFEVVDAASGLRTIRVRAPSARGVDIAGEFTEWEPVALSRNAQEWWTVTLPLAPGVYELNVRVDGGAWLVPPGLTLMRDEFGGSVGLLVVR